jgi:hypothetical protein
MTEETHPHPTFWMAAKPFAWSASITTSSLTAMWAVLTNAGPPLQPAILFWFLLVCPGMAFVRLLRLDDRLAQWVLAIAVSIALGVVLTETMIYSHRWNPVGAILTLAALSIIGAALDALMTAQRQPTNSRPT